MLNSAPSAVQFLSSVAVVAVCIYLLRVMIVWFVKADAILVHLRVISAAVGIPIADAKPSLLVRVFKRRGKLAATQQVANDPATIAVGSLPCPCCGTALPPAAFAQAQDHFVGPSRE